MRSALEHDVHVHRLAPWPQARIESSFCRSICPSEVNSAMFVSYWVLLEHVFA